MRDRFFIDTNVIVYANDRDDRAKRRAAREILDRAFASRRGCISTQVLQEFFVTATRKMGIPPANARAQVTRLMDLDTVIVDAQVLAGAMDLSIIHRVSVWDALIVKSASSAGCRTLYTEDLSHGQAIDGVRVHDPFAHPLR